MATTHAPGTGLGGGGLGKRGRWGMTQGRAAALAAALLAIVAIVVPFLIHALQDPDSVASKVAHETTQPATTSLPRHQTAAGAHDSALGTRTDLPALLPEGRPGLREGQAVRLGDITTGTLQRQPTTGWHVLVRWDGRLQALTTRGSVSLGSTSWVSRAGLLYSRVATGEPGRFHVYAWNPEGGTVYTPPTLVAAALGDVCFNQAFTDFGGCTG